MKDSTAERLRKIMAQRGLKQVDILKMAEPVCKKYNLKLTKSDLSQYVSGKVVPGQDKLTVLASALNISEAWLMGYDVPMERVTAPALDAGRIPATVPPGFQPIPRMVKKPLVGRIACGAPITAEQNVESYVDVPEGVFCDFCLECKGDSMIDAGIHDGDVVYIRVQPEVENGQIAAVRIGEEATLKKVYYDGENLILMPCNPAMQPKTFSGPALADIKIEGKAVGFTHWF